MFLPPFKASVDAGALSIMSAFNDVNGVPASGSRKLLTDILRGEWGFEGFVVSDYTSEQELVAHGFAEDSRDATRLAFNAGWTCRWCRAFIWSICPAWWPRARCRWRVWTRRCAAS